MGKLPFEIVLGSYEEFLLGFRYDRKENELLQTFANHSHSASVRSVAYCDGLLASGGTDDRIVVYDLRTRKEHCMLTHHDGTVNALSFTSERSHLISAGQDGALAIVRVGNWQLEKLWKEAHGGQAVLDVAVHPSGKLALTLGADCTLRTWNLIKGRRAYAINLNSKCREARTLQGVRWAPDGERFVLYGGRTTDVWSIKTGGVVKVIEHDVKVSSCTWTKDNALAVGYEDGTLTIVDVESGDRQTANKAHNARVKCLSTCCKRLVSAASDGEVKVWSLKLEEKAMINAGCRLTCVCTVPPIELKEESAVEEDASISRVDEVEEEQKTSRRKEFVTVETDRATKRKSKVDEERAAVKKKKRKNKS